MAKSSPFKKKEEETKWLREINTRRKDTILNVCLIFKIRHSKIHTPRENIGVDERRSEEESLSPTTQKDTNEWKTMTKKKTQKCQKKYTAVSRCNRETPIEWVTTR